MKHLIFTFLVFGMASCVSSKKHNQLTMTYHEMENRLSKTENSLAEEKEKTKDLSYKIESLEKDNDNKKDKIKDLDRELKFVRETNEVLNKTIEDISGTTKVNAEIMGKTLEELANKNSAILDLTASLNKKDSLNVVLVKRVKKKLSDRKLKRSLEKLGFVTY